MRDRRAYFRKYYKKNKKKRRLYYIRNYRFPRHIVLANKKRRANRAKKRRDAINDRVIKNRLKRDKRNKAIVRDFKNGMFCVDIQNKYNITRERCRQILLKYTGNKYKTYKEKIRYGKYGKVKDEVFNELVVLCKKLGRIPSYDEAVVEINNLKKYSSYGFVEFRKKLIKLGYKNIYDANKEKLINDILELTVKLGRIPTAFDLQKTYKLHYRYCFGSIDNVRRCIFKIINAKTKTTNT